MKRSTITVDEIQFTELDIRVALAQYYKRKTGITLPSNTIEIRHEGESDDGNEFIATVTVKLNQNDSDEHPDFVADEEIEEDEELDGIGFIIQCNPKKKGKALYLDSDGNWITSRSFAQIYNIKRVAQIDLEEKAKRKSGYSKGFIVEIHDGE